jgi:branched-chain amino acid aminotransferase
LDSLAPVSRPHLASVDGRLSPAPDAKIPITDDGLLRGDGAFEIARLYAGRPFALTEHLDRLERSAAAIELGFDRRTLEDEIEALLREYGEHDGGLRIVLTRGGRRVAICEPLPEWPPAVSVASVTYSPSQILTGVKSISYAANMQATRLAAARGAEEAILVRPDGVVLEAPTSAVFWVPPEGALQTPSIETGILESITRAVIVEALELTDGEFRLDELRAAQEAFLASTTREVQPISAVDGRELPEVPGPRTREAQEALAAAIRAELG